MMVREIALLALLGTLAVPTAATAQSDRAQEIVEAWIGSAHSRADSESFTHWNEEGEIPPACANCHSGVGFRDFIGADGSAPGIEHPVPIGSVVDCETCHNPVAESMSSVMFPSGVTVPDLGSSAVCMTCHQGRTSGKSVASAIADQPEDEINAELTFINVHYAVAAATLMGSVVHGGYEYDGKAYMGRFEHVPPFSSCTDCHDAHSLTVEVQQCTGCHQVNELAAIRTSTGDFDGDGDTSEGMRAEIDLMHERLAEAIFVYSRDVIGTPVVYAHSFPYFFTDTDADGVADPEETVVPNRYASWTPRLLKAAYNYQFIEQDPGAFSHNPHYALQILYDSIESLAQVAAIDMAGLQRP